MRRTAFGIVAALAATGSAHAQFSFTGLTGKTMKNAVRPEVRILGKTATGKTVPELENYFVWKRDHVKIQTVTFDVGKPNMVSERLFYFVDFNPAVTRVAPSLATVDAPVKLFETLLSSKGGPTVPTWENTEVYYSEAMRDLVGLTFSTQAQGEAFLKKLSELQRGATSPKKRVTLKSKMIEKKVKTSKTP